MDTFDWLLAPAFWVGLLAVLMLGTLVEYLAHRWMHHWLLRKKHAAHHRDGFGQGWLWEFLDYLLPTSPILVAGYGLAAYGLDSGAGAAGFVVGGLGFEAFAAYAHQLQHEKPELCFWLKKPIHFLHHHDKMWYHNFGISCDFWDRVFRTYKDLDWQPEPGLRSYRGLFTIKWL